MCYGWELPSVVLEILIGRVKVIAVSSSSRESSGSTVVMRFGWSHEGMLAPFSREGAFYYLPGGWLGYIMITLVTIIIKMSVIASVLASVLASRGQVIV
jgi:hypothetical protein